MARGGVVAAERRRLMVKSAPRELADLEKRIARCRLCIEQPRGKPLPHEPNPIVHLSPTARLCIAGQAAGTLAHASSKPFNDPSGVRLRDWMGITPDQFYDRARLAIVPMGLCFPGLDARGSDLPPRRECAPRWRPEIFAAMPQVELLLAIGQYAQAWHLGSLRGKNLTETVANWREMFEATDRPKVLPLPHPSWRNNAWIKRNPWFETDLLPVLRAEVARLMG
jgi:uracil-DNA glycosylase